MQFKQIVFEHLYAIVIAYVYYSVILPYIYLSVNAQRFLIARFALRRTAYQFSISVCVSVCVLVCIDIAFAQEVGYGKMSNNNINSKKKKCEEK